MRTSRIFTQFARWSVLAAVLAAARCSGPAGPSLPLPDPASPPRSSPPPLPAESSIATLAISSFEVIAAGRLSGVYWYRPNMVLVETSGNSAATLLEITFSSPGGNVVIDATSPPGRGCFLTTQSKTVPAGQSWDFTNVYYYCLDIDSPVDIAATDVRVTVNFSDDQGRPGMVTGTAMVRK